MAILPVKSPSTTVSSNPKPRIKRNVRKELVARYIGLTGLSDTQKIVKFIKDKTGKSVEPRTIKQDVENILLDAKLFQRDLALSTWMAKVLQMYQEINQEIDEIQSLKQKILDADPNIPDALVKLMEQIEDPKERQALMKSLHRAYGSAETQKVLGKVNYASKILDEKRSFLINLVTSVPLYNQAASLAKYYEQHHKE